MLKRCGIVQNRGAWLVVAVLTVVGVLLVSMMIRPHLAYVASVPQAEGLVTLDDYIVLVSALHAVDGDGERARERLARIGIENPAERVANLAELSIQRGSGQGVIVDLATLAHVLGVDRPSLAAYIATPAPRVGPPVESLPSPDWDMRLTAKLDPPVKWVPAEVGSGQTYWRLVRAYWQSPEEGGYKYHIFVNVLNKDGVPIPQPVVIENGGKLVVPAEAKPDSDYLINYPMAGTLGSYTLYVAGDLPSDRVVGLGLGYAKGGKDHTSFLLTFQETVAP